MRTTNSDTPVLTSKQHGPAALCLVEPYQAQLACSLQIDKCFGYETAVEEAQNALLAAKVEATSGYRGIGLVKLMGRQSGFITVQVRQCRMVLSRELPNCT